jgi:site-specific DNA-methyltransferase (adenine-specific)
MIENYNPDVLTCLANLSNDEVFTPPELVNDILDLLPKELFENKETTFLDPVCKSGVFLREIAKRLMTGLEKEIPDKQKRINHIFKNQLFGIAITDLTSLLSRRSVYCTKTANGKYSVCDDFYDVQGNIIYKRIYHKWKNGKCEFCGASKKTYSRGKDLETHAYQFIHTDKPEEFFKMKFDVIIGNPPYQLNDGGGMGTSAVPIYQKFIEQAKKLNPRYLSMIIPARWYSGGKGLDSFRNEMLNDNRIRTLVDYFDSTQCFPGVDISGGICYFLWDRDNKGDCSINSRRNDINNKMRRPLLEPGQSFFIRFNEAVSIIRKIKQFDETLLVNEISSRNPFGIFSSVDVDEKQIEDSVKIFSYPKNGFIRKNKILKNQKWISEYKVYIAKAYGERGSFPYLVIGKPFLGDKGTCCSETYLVFGPFSSKKYAENLITYMMTRFFRFLVLQKKNTQNAAKGVYELVPTQNFDESWTDQKLYKKYGLTSEEIKFIESMIRPMEVNNE